MRRTKSLALLCLMSILCLALQGCIGLILSLIGSILSSVGPALGQAALADDDPSGPGDPLDIDSPAFAEGPIPTPTPVPAQGSSLRSVRQAAADEEESDPILVGGEQRSGEVVVAPEAAR